MRTRLNVRLPWLLLALDLVLTGVVHLAQLPAARGRGITN